MTNNNHRGIQATDELLQHLEAAAVEVVRGLVEQIGVEAREQQYGQTNTGRRVGIRCELVVVGERCGLPVELQLRGQYSGAAREVLAHGLVV